LSLAFNPEGGALYTALGNGTLNEQSENGAWFGRVALDGVTTQVPIT
jgi:hypothetical protein